MAGAGAAMMAQSRALQLDGSVVPAWWPAAGKKRAPDTGGII
jgi:hypothetical protein